jgi:opacity protein-like surface antigen
LRTAISSLAALAVLLVAPSAYAGMSGLGLGVHGGIVSGYDNPVLAEGISDSLGIDVSEKMTDLGAHVKIGTFRIIEFDLNLDYAWKKQDLGSGFDLRFSDFSITGSVRKSIAMTSIKPYIGVGAGLHWMAYSLESGDQVLGVVLPENESKIGYHFKAGVDLDIPLLPLTPYGEWKYNVIQTTGKSTKYSSLMVGVTLDLP